MNISRCCIRSNLLSGVLSFYNDFSTFSLIKAEKAIQTIILFSKNEADWSDLDKTRGGLAAFDICNQLNYQCTELNCFDRCIMELDLDKTNIDLRVVAADA